MSSQSTTVTSPNPVKGEVILRIIGLSKRFGKLEAVKNLNLELRRGEVFGFLGPNGAGKSTTVGIILGLIAPTTGNIELFGHNFKDNQWTALRRIGAVIEEPAFYPYIYRAGIICKHWPGLWRHYQI